MFLDSDANSDISSYGDDNFSNHPGWFKDVFNPKGAESDRYKDEENEQKANCDYAAGDSCVELQECNEFFQDIYDSNTGNSRVPKRKRKAANHHRNKVKSYLSARDCNISTTVSSEIDDSIKSVNDKNEELAEIRNQLTQLGEDSAAQSEATFKQAQDLIDSEAAKSAKEKKSLYIVGGALVGVMLLVLILKK